MSNKSRTIPVRESHGKLKYRFDLVVGYEDATTRSRALRLYDRLAQQLLAEYDFRCAWWKFNHLQDDSLMAQAIDDATAANMIILSLSARPCLPLPGKAWIENWAARKAKRKSALVALLDMSHQPAAAPNQIQDYLQQIARSANMDFFFHATDAGMEKHLCTVETLVKQAKTVTPLLQGILQRRSVAPRISLN